MLTIADVIFPAFYAPYVIQLLVPVAAIAALASEVAFYRWWSKDQRLGRLIVVVVIANVLSSIIGMVIAYFLPNGYNPAFPSHSTGPWHGPEWDQLAEIAWVVAFLVSILVEWPVLVLFRRFIRIPRTFTAAVFANATSYVVLLVVFALSALAHR